MATASSPLICYYDLSRCPPTFDGVAAALHFEQKRRAIGAGAMEVHVVGPGFRNDQLWPFGVAARIRIKEAILKPIFRMLPHCAAVVDVDRGAAKIPRPGSFGFGQVVYHFGNFVRAYAAGIRPLRPATELAVDSSLVTITLREAEHWPERNSKLLEWIAAGEHMAKAGWNVVFVRDTKKAGETLPGGARQDAVAAVSLEARATLYRSAFCNLFVNNGPAWFAMALDAPAVIVRPATEGSNRVFGEDWFRRVGLAPRGQFPHSAPFHMLHWSDDNAGSIVDAFVRFEAANQGRTYASPVHA